MRRKSLILVLIFIFFIGLSINLLLTTKKTTNISWIASERLADINGRMLEINNVSGKRYTILNFWATWCAPCIEEMPSLSRLQSNTAFKNLQIVPINVGRDNVEKSKNFYKKLKIDNLEIYFDKDVELAKKFLLRGLPTTVFINKKGEEFARVIGFINFDDKKIIKWLKTYD